MISENRPYKIVVGIPTFKRPEMLRKLLLSILENKLDPKLIKEINVIVVDNDNDKSAEPIVWELKNQFENNFTLLYHSYPVKGLSNVRNEIFKSSLDLDPHYIACIDDDEYPSSEWLTELVLMISTNQADIVMGPVIPVFEKEVPPKIARWFKARKLNNNQKVTFFETSNFIISSNFLFANKISFDNRFNSTGGEDSYFGIVALKKEANIFWASKAIIYETIPVKRATLQWLLKRGFRYSNTRIYILLLEKQYGKILKRIGVKTIYFFGGIIALVLLPFPSKNKFWGPINIAESIGTFTGIFNIKYHEYKKDTKL